MEPNPPSREHSELPEWQQFAQAVMKACRAIISRGESEAAFVHIQAGLIEDMHMLMQIEDFDYAALQQYFYTHQSPIHLVALSKEEALGELVEQGTIDELEVRDLVTREPREYFLSFYLDDGIVRPPNAAQRHILEDHDENLRRLNGLTGMMGKTMDKACEDSTHPHNAQWN